MNNWKRWLIVGSLCLTTSGGLVVAQDDQTISPELEDQFEDLEAQTSVLRDLDGEPVVRDFPNQLEVGAFVIESMTEELPPTEVVRYQSFYDAFDLMPPDTDLIEVYTNLLSSQIAGYYDPETDTMNVVNYDDAPIEELDLLSQTTYVHEYTHALQDQFYDLIALLEDNPQYEHPDGGLALTSLVEGDATVVMTLWIEALVEENPMAAFQLIGDVLGTADSVAMPEGTPEILQDELLFPYEQGAIFVQALLADGGWEAVDAAYDNPPASTEQILHPEKYLAGEAPDIIALPDVSESLGAGWTSLWNHTLGEWYLRQHLSRGLNASSSDADIVEGWQGDTFRIYMPEDGSDMAWALRLAWDSAGDEQEFTIGYIALMDTEFGTADDSMCWTVSDGFRCISSVNGQTVIAQASTPELTLALLDASSQDE